MHADGPEAKFAPFSLIPRIAVIGLLAASAGFKAEELASGATGSFPWKQGALVSWELVLALWLASGVLWQAATRTAMGTFGLFASVSLAMAANGRSTCGCMGQVQVSPWLMFTVDASLVVLLACSPGEPPKLTRGTLAAPPRPWWLACLSFSCMPRVVRKQCSRTCCRQSCAKEPGKSRWFAPPARRAMHI